MEEFGALKDFAVVFIAVAIGLLLIIFAIVTAGPIFLWWSQFLYKHLGVQP